MRKFVNSWEIVSVNALGGSAIIKWVFDAGDDYYGDIGLDKQGQLDCTDLPKCGGYSKSEVINAYFTALEEEAFTEADHPLGIYRTLPKRIYLGTCISTFPAIGGMQAKLYNGHLVFEFESRSDIVVVMLDFIDREEIEETLESLLKSDGPNVTLDLAHCCNLFYDGNLDGFDGKATSPAFE